MTMSDEKDDFDYERAELFEAIGHPTRIKILKTLGERPMSFTDLKKSIGIESSGHMSFHLSKLASLVKATSDGTYTLTDDGREALRIVEAMKPEEPMSPKNIVSLTFIAICVVFIASASMLFLAWWQGITSFQTNLFKFTIEEVLVLFASSSLCLLYFSYKAVLTILKRNKKRNYGLIAVFILIWAALFSGFFLYPYIRFQEEMVQPNPFQKVSVTGVEANKMLIITVNYMNDGGSDANVTNIFVDGKPITSYTTFVDVRDASGISIKSLLDGKGYIIPYNKGHGEFPKGNFTIVFTTDAFASGQVIDIGFHTAADGTPNQVSFSATCKIP
jgi:DNA-binding transcriptional ArsR family regulator